MFSIKNTAEKAIFVLTALICIGIVEAKAEPLNLTSADLQSQAVQRQKAQDFEKLDVMSKFLSMSCGARKDGVPFTQEELAGLVLAGQTMPHMRAEVCGIFRSRQSV